MPLSLCAHAPHPLHTPTHAPSALPVLPCMPLPFPPAQLYLPLTLYTSMPVPLPPQLCFCLSLFAYTTPATRLCFYPSLSHKAVMPFFVTLHTGCASCLHPAQRYSCISLIARSHAEPSLYKYLSLNPSCCKFDTQVLIELKVMDLKDDIQQVSNTATQEAALEELLTKVCGFVVGGSSKTGFVLLHGQCCSAPLCTCHPLSRH